MTHTTHVQFQKTRDVDVLTYKRAVLLLGGLIVVLAALYTYALGSTIHLVLTRSAYEKQAATLQSAIAQLQVNYLAASDSVTIERGQALGLREATNVSFVRKATSGGGELSFVDTHKL
jgi:hypothetical protein